MKTTARRSVARPIDTAWFVAAIKASRFGSMRALAGQVQGLEGLLGQPALSRLVNGKRAMRIEEARQLADLLGVPFTEVLRRAGIDVRDKDDDLEARHRAAVRMVRTLLAFIDEAGVSVPKRVREQAAGIG